MTGINGGTTLTTGFGHEAILASAGAVIEGVKTGISAASSWWADATAPVRAGIIIRSS